MALELDEEKVFNVIRSDKFIFQYHFNDLPTGLKLTNLEWKIFVLINGHNTVADIAKNAHVKLNVVKLALYNFIEKKLIVKVDQPTDIFIDIHDIKNIEMQLTRILGPVAGIIIDDVLAEMQLSRSSVKKEEIYTFIEQVSNEITDDDKKIKFQEIMLEMLKTITL